ncbi:GLPGLI family protein [Chryseobacterium aahli]|uniref:GLPGLI family protein n=1 Tax=Chryseobacterium aahli TaxID=1278643 RepID=UPI001F60F4C2|nr:GLPGLI family protein [Chryseobacterium aahli]MCI3936141.1 GLPGLI family protein [Chryseobacterium aahli]
MQKALVFIGIFMSLFYYSQTNRFVYELQYRRDSTEDYRKTLMNLDITAKTVKFYDKQFADYDSINKEAQTTVSKFSTKTDQIISREINSFKNNWYRDFFEYFVVKTNDEMTWKLMSETQNYNGYQLQKATTDFGGRIWVAWFSNDVDIKEGPYKFRGLPGLIFLLEDSEKNFIYRLKKNVKLPQTYDTTDFIETHFGKQAIPITNQKFNTYLEDLYLNPTRMISENIKNGGKANFKNENIESIEDLNSKKGMLQNGIKGRYIFIEKDKQPNFKK